MKRKVLSVLLAVCLLVGALPMAAGAEEKPASGFCGANVTWDLDTSTGELVIEGAGPMKNYFRFNREGSQPWGPPWGFDNMDIRRVVIKPGVTSVGDYAFYGCDNITSVTFPETVKRIEDYAFFGCEGLEEATLPKRMEYLGRNSFELCSLKSVAIPEGLTQIESHAFAFCIWLESVTIPEGIVGIGDYAFACCPITALALPNTLTDIRSNAFIGCEFTSITVPDSVTYIDEAAFADCSFLTSITLPDSITYINDGTFAHTGFTSITLPDSITGIGEGAFQQSELQSITIPDGVTHIGDCAFYLCSDLASITIPASVTRIGREAFKVCSEDLVIHGIAGSYAETYARENSIPFAAMQPSTPTPPPVPGPVTPIAPVEPDPEPAAPTFIDVPSDAYYADAVQWAVENNITSGTDETHFSPDASCTRAQAVTFLWRAANKPEPQNTGVKFNDVETGSYYEKAVQWAVEQGITSGTGNGKFSPDAVCTRAQIVVFLYRAQGSPEIAWNNSFTDIKAGDYYENAVKWAVERGIAAGTGGSRFSPDDISTRGQIVTFLHRYSK